MVNRTAQLLDGPVASLQARRGAGEEQKKREAQPIPAVRDRHTSHPGEKASLDGRWLLTRAPLWVKKLSHIQRWEMRMETSQSIIKQSLTDSTNIREFLDGSVRSFEVLRTAGIGLGTYQPGWRWSLHAGPQTGKPSENHIGYVISGHFIVRDAAGSEVSIGPGDAFELAPGSDAWVDGNETCVALDFISYEAHNSIAP